MAGAEAPLHEPYHVRVSLKAERIHLARRVAIRNGLTDYGMDLDQAERWCDAWEFEAASQGIGRSAEYWQDGRRWIDDWTERAWVRRFAQ